MVRLQMTLSRVAFPILERRAILMEVKPSFNMLKSVRELKGTFALFSNAFIRDRYRGLARGFKFGMHLFPHHHAMGKNHVKLV